MHASARDRHGAQDKVIVYPSDSLWTSRSTQHRRHQALLQNYGGDCHACDNSHTGCANATVSWDSSDSGL